VNRSANGVHVQFPRGPVGETGWAMGWGPKKIRKACCLIAGLVLLALPARAQLQVGDYLHMNLNGNVGATYAGGVDQGLSDHALGFSGNGVLTGNYYNSNFLNFNVDPFYNREQNDSIFGSLTNTTGVTSNVNLFNGSHFPGSISYNRLFNATGQFGVPGSDIGLAQHTNTQGFALGWSALVPDWPTLTASYAIGDGSNDVLGEPGSDKESDRTLTLLSAYKVDGFQMSGQFMHRNMSATDGEFLLPGEVPFTTNSSSNDYSATVQHSLPLTGNFGASYNHINYGYDYHDSSSTSNSGASNTVNGSAAFHPIDKLGVAFIANYNDNLLGSIPQPVLNSGTPVDLPSAGSFRSVLVGTDVYYQLLRNLGVHFDVNHQQQWFLGESYEATQFGGTANFTFDHSLLKGLSFSFGMVDTAQQQSNTGLGFVGNLNYDRKFFGWDVSGNFSYAQNVQTVMLVYTTSSYSYLASIRRRVGERKYFMAGYGGSHSGITANSGTTSSAERFWSTFIYRGNSLNAFYNKSTGLAIFTPTGLVPIPTTLPSSVFSPDSVTSYNNSGYGFSLGVNPVRRLTISASYVKSHGSTIDPTLSAFTSTQLMNAIMQYRLRKIFVNAGFTRLRQNVGTPSSSPFSITSYYIGFSRWFNFF